MGALLDKFEQLARQEVDENDGKEEDGNNEEKKEEKPMSLDQELRFYVTNGDEKKVGELVKGGADVNAPHLPEDEPAEEDGKKKEEKLYNVAVEITGDYPLHLAAAANHANIVSQLFYLGANMENKNRIGSTALHRAVSMGNKEATMELLKLGADVHAVNGIGNTALHIACCCSNKEMIELLLANGASSDLQVKNKVYLTPIEYTQRKSAERKLLLDKDASLSQFLQSEEDEVAHVDEPEEVKA